MSWFSILKSLLTVFVFSILAVGGAGAIESYKCAVSECQNGNCYMNVSCETTYGCYTKIMELKVPSQGAKSEVMQKGCATNKKACGLEFSATLGGEQKFRYKHHCCTSEQCNKENIALSSLSSEPNGVECPACYNDQNSTCPILTTLKCTGAEKRCVEVTGTAGSVSVLYAKGCATESACKLDIDIFNMIHIKTTCSQAVSTKSVASLPIVLLLLKTML